MKSQKQEDMKFGKMLERNRILKLIEERLLEARRKLKPHLPQPVKANLSGMILALEELKQNITKK